MKLKDIIQHTGYVETHGSLDIDITAITCDSREVTPGSLFIAVMVSPPTGISISLPPWRKGRRP